jgi:pre-rRNA-processing protein TSR1
MYAALDACKAADYVLFLLSSTVEVDDWGDTLLRTLQAQGLPQVVTAVAPNPSLDSRDRADVQKSLLSFIRYFVPGQNRVFDLHVSSDRLNALRALSEGKPDDVRWREGRTWILGEKVEWREGMLAVTGVVRGAQLSANRLIHLADYGDFPISKVCTSRH